MPNSLTETDYKSAAQTLGVPTPAVKAVASVESAGAGFLSDGRPKILFERHVMYAQLSAKLGKAKADQLAAKHPDIVNPGLRGGWGQYPENSCCI